MTSQNMITNNNNARALNGFIMIKSFIMKQKNYIFQKLNIKILLVASGYKINITTLLKMWLE